MDVVRRIETLAVATTAAGLAFRPLLYADDAVATALRAICSSATARGLLWG